MTIITTTAAEPTDRTTDPTGAARRITYGPLIAWVLAAAFTLSAAHTVYSELADIADPGFRIDGPVVWIFYALGFGSALLARRSGRNAQVTLLAYLAVLLGIGVLYYPTTFTEERQTVFGWIENDVYLGLLMIAAALSVLRLCRIELVADSDVGGPSANESTSVGTEREPIDVHDMVVVHRAFRREFRVIPELIRRVPAGATQRAELVASHLRLCLDGLHLHHTSEDDLLWPLLSERAAPSDDLIRRMQDQHAVVEDALAQVEPVLARWEAEARPVVGVELAASVDALYDVVVTHLDDEERMILPLAAHHLSQDEWSAIGQAGVAKMTTRQLPLMFGMVMEDASVEERREMLAILPLPVRLLLRTWGARHYARYVTSIRK